MSKAIMHRQEELEYDLMKGRGLDGFLSLSMIQKWFDDRYSTSKHLFLLYSLVRGLNAKHILEIGFGRSSFVLMKAVHETGGQFIVCDKKGLGKNEGFQYLLSKQERGVIIYLHGKSPLAWEYLSESRGGLDFAFLDYFGDKNLNIEFCIKEIEYCLSFMKKNGIIAIHDTFVDEYGVKDILGNLSDKDYKYITLPYCYGLTLIRKTESSLYGELKENFLKKEDPNVG